MMTQAPHSDRQIAPVRRVPLGDAWQDALRTLLFDATPPRAVMGRTPIKGADAGDATGTVILIEAARRPDIEVVLQGFDVRYVPIYQGASADTFARHAPYLAEIRGDSRAADWLIDESWGQGWGVWLRSDSTLAGLRKQFRKFTQLYNPDEDRWYVFRFYAPETVRRVVPLMRPADFADFTQGIDAVVVPGVTRAQALVI